MCTHNHNDNRKNDRSTRNNKQNDQGTKNKFETSGIVCPIGRRSASSRPRGRQIPDGSVISPPTGSDALVEMGTCRGLARRVTR